MIESSLLLEAAEHIARGEIGVIPTDTLYGIVASAANPSAVERLYRVRGRNEQKPCIVLIDALEAIECFDRALSDEEQMILSQVWPGKVSVVLSGFGERLTYLHRGTGTIAFRVPDDASLREMLHLSGPILAPSANPEGMKPAETIEEASFYFGNGIDFLVDGGRIAGEPSTVIQIENGTISILRQGAGIIRK